MLSSEHPVPNRCAAPVPPSHVALDQTFTSYHLFSLRNAIAAHATEFGLTARRAEDLILVAHELASNAVRHAGVTSAMPGRLRLWRDGDVIVCQVSDDGPGLIDLHEAGVRPAAVTASSGRGLWIARQVADRVDISTGPEGTTVTTTLRISDSRDRRPRPDL
jgi:anti-sigma regulatory factor (Ser/Thr protein kinase)